jgi:hypothetical protein
MSSLSQNFNWTSWAKTTGTVLNEATAVAATAVDEATLKVELPGNVSCAPVMLDVSAGTLTCTIDENAVPQGEGNTQTARVWLDRVGYAVTDPDDPWFELRPMVSSIAVQRPDETAWRSGKAAQSGSLGGGLALLIRGRGFVKDYLNYIRVAEVTADNAIYYGYCTDIDVINSTALTCITPAFSYTSTTVVTVVVNGTESTCETYGTGQCDFTMSDNSTDDTPIVSSFSPTTGIYDPEQQQLVQIVGDGFVPGNTTITIGSAECAMVTENATNLACALPRQVAGLFELEVHVVAKGLAVGDQLWFTFGVEVRPSAERSGWETGGTGGGTTGASEAGERGGRRISAHDSNITNHSDDWRRAPHGLAANGLDSRGYRDDLLGPRLCNVYSRRGQPRRVRGRAPFAGGDAVHA